MAHTRYVLDKHGYMQVRACTRSHAMVPTCTHASAGTHRPIRHRLFVAFPQQQWLRERVSMLRYTYIACIVLNTRCDSHEVPTSANEFLAIISVCIHKFW